MLFLYPKIKEEANHVRETEIIDPRPEAELAQTERDYYEDRYNRDLKRKLEANTHPFAKKLLAACGLL